MTTFRRQTDIYLTRITTRKRNPIKPTSAATIKSLHLAALPVLGQMDLDLIRSNTLRTLVDVLCDQGYAANSIEAITTAAKLVVESELDSNGDPKTREWNNDHIFENVPAKPEKARVITASQLEAKIAVAPPIVREFICTQAASGCRKGELLALHVSDFDKDIGLLHVSRTLSYYGVTSTKTKRGNRKVDVVPQIAAMLTAMLDGRTTGPLFDISLDNLRGAFETLKIKSHGLRHFRYTHLQRFYKILPPALHNYWIGHAMKGMAETYGHIHEDDGYRRQLAREIGLGFALPQVEPAAEEVAAMSPATEAEALAGMVASAA